MTRRIAIACQGGGSHAAFTAGVLDALLRRDALWQDRTLVAVSGTSGGALCAALVWSRLRHGLGERAAARANLLDFWNALGSYANPDLLANQFAVNVLLRNPFLGDVPPPAVSLYASARMISLLMPRLDFSQPDDDAPLELYLGAVNVKTGERHAFCRKDELRIEHVLASAAVPPLYLPQPVGGSHYWDGLFATNPPIRELIDHDPDEIWVIQLNPSFQPSLPVWPSEILDRRNELAGNLALRQELHFLRRINALCAASADGTLTRPDRDKPYRHIELKTIEMNGAGLDYASKLDIAPKHIQDLLNKGRQAAAAIE